MFNEQQVGNHSRLVLFSATEAILPCLETNLGFLGSTCLNRGCCCLRVCINCCLSLFVAFAFGLALGGLACVSFGCKTGFFTRSYCLLRGTIHSVRGVDPTISISSSHPAPPLPSLAHIEYPFSWVPMGAQVPLLSQLITQT